MAQYKVPQDVEADDKLLGPFNFRQFVYLLIAGGLIALAVALFQLFPLLALIPLPFILLLAALALPLKKDQPMETYLAAIVSYYLKPRVRKWAPGQKESTILITAPKRTEEESRARDLTGDEATHRLSFLADIVDTEGYAIKGVGLHKLNDELVEEANMTNDMFETSHFDSLENTIARDENDRHAKLVQDMREAIEKTENTMSNEPLVSHGAGMEYSPVDDNMTLDSSVVVEPDVNSDISEKRSSFADNAELQKNNGQIMAKPSIIELANNTDFSVATISKEANRIKERDEGEVFISLH